jgi:two-component system cell cycle sensor histidine kinase PleC
VCDGSWFKYCGRIMLNGTAGAATNGTLMNEYAMLVAGGMLRRRAWRAEQTARVETTRARQVKSDFIGTMSHELRTPLNAIIGFAKLLREHEHRRLRAREIAAYADVISDAADHLLATVNDILDIAKMQAGKYPLEVGEVDLPALLGAIAAAFAEHAADAGVSLTSTLDPKFPVIAGDANKLRRAFANLVGNAIKFTPPGGRVAIEGGRGPDGGVRVVVRDTGLGMSKDEIEVALTPFAQVESGPARRWEGAGLGLPLAKALVELHGGRLEVLSARRRGTRVIVRLPRACGSAG